jgi:hypothetical protein
MTTTNDRPDLSTEGAPDIYKTVQDLLTDWSSVVTWLWLDFDLSTVLQNHENDYVRGIGQGEAKENIIGLKSAVVTLTTVQVTKLPLYHKVNEIGMISFEKPGLTQDLYIM